MGLLLPEIHRLLVLNAALVEQNVDDVGVGQVTVPLKALANDLSHGGWGNIEGVQYANFRSLFMLRILGGQINDKLRGEGMGGKPTPRIHSRYKSSTRLR